MTEPAQKVSVLVTSLNSPTLSRCLTALERYTGDIYELVIVADEPTPEHWRLLKRWAAKGATLLVNSTRVGSEVATNQGIAVSRGNYIALVTSDVFVERGWLAPLIAALDKHPGFGWVASSAEENGAQIPFLGGCSLFSRKMLKEIGVFDEVYLDGDGFSDDDFYHRALKAGYRPCGVKESFVRHPHPRSTVGPSPPDAYLKNQKLLYERHGVIGTHWDELPVYSVATDGVDVRFGHS